MIRKSIGVVALFSYLAALPAHADNISYGTMAPVSSVSSASIANRALLPIEQVRIDGITKTILAYPAQTPEILQNYVGLDVSKLDFSQFMQIVARGNYAELQQEVTTLYVNREGFNSGTFTDVSYYMATPAPAPQAPVPADVVAKIETAEPVSSSVSPASGLKTALLDTKLGVIAASTAVGLGIAAGMAVGGSGSGDSGSNWGSSDDDDNNNGSPLFVDNRTALPDTATPSSFVDSEFLAYSQDGLSQSNAQYAFAKGLTGAGVSIGFHDLFYDSVMANPELSSRISYRNLNTPADVTDLNAQCAGCNHGEDVMESAAAARNGSGTLGFAFGADLLMNSWNAGSATALADNGADIVNFSCTGCTTMGDLQYLDAAGVFMTASTGNDYLYNPNPLGPASFASLFDYSLLAVNGAIESGGNTLSPIAYNYCGNQKEYCLTAYSSTGTSFAAPQVAGAAALLKEGWGYLTPKQLGQILLYSARDVGDPGVDDVFGHGILDLATAIEPMGTISTINGLGASVNFSPSVISQNQVSAFGDAFSTAGNAKGTVVVLDAFGRDFHVKPQDNLNVVREDKFSADNLFALGRKKQDMQTIRLNDGLSMKFRRQQNNSGTADIVGFAEYDVNPAAKVKLGFATDMADVATNEMQKFNASNFISQDSFRNGYLNLSDNDQVFSQSIELIPAKDVKVKVSSYYSENSDIDYFKPVDNKIRSDFASSVVDTSFTPHKDVTVNLRNGMTHEFDSLLGTKFSGVFEMEDGADTYFTGVDVSYDIAPNWNIFGSYTLGKTQATPSARSAFSSVSDLTSDSFSVAATRSALLGDDSLTLAVGQPTRVRSGTASGLTQSVDRATGDVSVASFQQSLVPTGRNLQFQAAYQKELNDKLDMNLALEYETNPYQQANAQPETAGFMKFIYTFGEK